MSSLHSQLLLQENLLFWNFCQLQGRVNLSWCYSDILPAFPHLLFFFRNLQHVLSHKFNEKKPMEQQTMWTPFVLAAPFLTRQEQRSWVMPFHPPFLCSLRIVPLLSSSCGVSHRIIHTLPQIGARTSIFPHARGIVHQLYRHTCSLGAYVAFEVFEWWSLHGTHIFDTGGGCIHPLM